MVSINNDYSEQSETDVQDKLSTRTPLTILHYSFKEYSTVYIKINQIF